MCTRLTLNSEPNSVPESIPLVILIFGSVPQNEKKMQLTQQETNKIKERDEQHTQELREWRAEIARKKQVSQMVCGVVWK